MTRPRERVPAFLLTALVLAAPRVASAQSAPAPAATPSSAPAVTPAVTPVPAERPVVTVRPGVEVFAQYAFTSVNTADGASVWDHRFDLTRAFVWVDTAYSFASARVLLEAVRSASEGSLLGVAGDSLVVRIREAYAAARWRTYVDARAGVVPTLTVPALERAWGMRALAPTSLETSRLASYSDLGAVVRGHAPGGWGTLSLGAFNGEGYTNRELNRGKNFEASLEVHPWPRGLVEPLSVLLTYTAGSSGTGLARADRFTGAVRYDGARFGAGAAFTYGWGVEDQGARESYVAEVFARVEPITGLLLAGRFTYWQRDVADETDRVMTVLGAVGARPVEPLELFAAVSRSIPAARAAQALPSSDAWELRLVARAYLQQ